MFVRVWKNGSWLADLYLPSMLCYSKQQKKLMDSLRLFIPFIFPCLSFLFCFLYSKKKNLKVYVAATPLRGNVQSDLHTHRQSLKYTREEAAWWNNGNLPKKLLFIDFSKFKHITLLKHFSDFRSGFALES